MPLIIFKRYSIRIIFTPHTRKAAQKSITLKKVYQKNQPKQDNMKKVIVISTSLRAGSNSDMLADKFIEGALQAGHEVEKSHSSEKIYVSVADV